MTTITELPPAPDRSDPTTFSDRGDALLGAFATFVSETNTVAGECVTNAATATTQAGLATTNGAAQVSLAAAQVSLATAQVALATTQATNSANSATAAAASVIAAGATLWVSGTTYAIGNARYSPLNGQTYRRLTAGAGTTDPSADSTNWIVVNGLTSEAIVLPVNNLPVVRPTLLLDFANSKTVDPRITFTRASTATRINDKGLIETVASGAPRIDYDPVTLACKGLLIEESRTNLLTYSEQFDNAAWTKPVFTVTANATTAPDVTITADKLDEATTASTDRYAQQVQTISASASYTASVCLKAAERSTAQVRLSSNNGTFSTVIVNVNLSAGTIGSAILTGGAVSGSATISALQNGWYRVSVTGVLAGDVTIAGIFVYAHNGTTTTYAGVPGSGFYTWGAQLEAGAFATSYIPTTSAQVTRAADSATMTGANFSSWYRQDEFTSVVKFIANAAGTQMYAAWNDGTANEEIKLESVAGTLTLTVTDGGVAKAALALGSVTTGTTYTVVAAWKVNDIAASINGAAVVTDTAATLPTPTQMVFGSSVTVVGYPTRLANATLVALSTP